MSIAGWCLFVGGLLLSLVLLGSLLQRLPVSAALLYLVTGWLLGPDVAGVLAPDPVSQAGVLERLAEAGLLISLFAVGLELEVPLRDRRWWLPIRLATVSMATMVVLVTAVGVWGLGLTTGAAVLLGAILAPTDPVLASGLQAEAGADPAAGRLRFSLAAEGGLNDGAAFPMVMLGLGLLGLHDLGNGGARWWMVDVAWATLGGLAIGGAVGAACGALVVRLRARHGEALGLDVFLALGLVALAYGTAQLAEASGFLAVFACGLALRRVAEPSTDRTAPLARPTAAAGHPYEVLSSHPAHASATMRASVRLFNGQLEKLAELGLVLLVGALLPSAAHATEALWFVPMVLVALRPLSAWVGIVGERLDRGEAAMAGWFGIRGIGSVYYLFLVLRHGIDDATAGLLVSLTLWTVATSIVVHGLTARPLMRRYLAAGRAPAGPGPADGPRR